MTTVPPLQFDVPTADLVASRHINKKDLAKEASLMKTCWWEYRGIHPTNRTLLFTAEFVAARQRYTGKYTDYARSEYVSGMRGDSRNPFTGTSVDPAELALMTPAQAKSAQAKAKSRARNMTGLWRARQAADENCCNYRLWISAIFEKASMTGWEHLPQATHLYSDKAKMTALDAMVHELESYIPDFTNPALMAGSTAPFKGEFDTWLYEFGQLRKIHKDLGYRSMASKGYITPDQAEAWIELSRSM